MNQMEKGSNFDHIAKILIIGETGAGKSTLINYLCNYFHHGDLKNLKVAIPCQHHPFPTEHFVHHELDIHDNTRSKTDACSQYLFTDPRTHKQYLFLDTPGLSDTRGREQNDVNMNKIIDALIQLGTLTSVIIVVNGSISRLTVNLRSVIACLNGNIPDVVLENVLVVLTNVKKHQSPFDFKVLHIHGKIYPFYMQNDVFVSDPQTWKQSLYDELQHDWSHSMNEIKHLLGTIDSFKQISIDAFIQMQQIRTELKITVHQTRLEIQQMQTIENELSQLDQDLRFADRETAAYQNHTRLRTIDKIEVIDAPDHSTLCADCNEVCHPHCLLNETSVVGSQIFSQCSVMINGHCQRCPNRCSYLRHYHAKKSIQITFETLHDVLKDLKEKYDQAYRNRSVYLEKILSKSEGKELLERALAGKLEEIQSKSVKLLQICSAFNLAEEMQCLINEPKLEAESFKDLTAFIQLVEERQAKTRRKRSRLQIIDHEQTFERKPTDIHQLPTANLVELYHQTIDHSLLTSILNELHRRALGKSTGPLLTSAEMILINKSLQSYSDRNIPELSYRYHKLQQQIQHIIQSDILKIVEVNAEILIENFIVQTLLDEKEKADEHRRDPYINNSFPHRHSNLIPDTPRTNSVPIGFSHLTIAPYPSLHEPSQMPNLPANYSPIIQSDRRSSQAKFCSKDYQYDSMDRNSSLSSIAPQRLMSVTVPTNNQPSSIKSYDFALGFSLQNAEEHQRATSLSDRPSIPDVIPSDTSVQRNDGISDLDDDGFCLLGNARLLEMYADSDLKKDESRKNAIYEELRRRCYGNYPMLVIEEKQSLEKKLQSHQMKTMQELQMTQAAVRRQIRGYLPNDEATFIENVPTDLIIEANALSELISSKQS